MASRAVRVDTETEIVVPQAQLDNLMLIIDILKADCKSLHRELNALERKISTDGTQHLQEIV